jgi:parallel beta-helix repeat protein
VKNGIIQGGSGGVVINLERARVANVLLMAWDLDNTGSRANEQLNIVDNQFTGPARLWFQRCDTPLIRKNRFEYPGPKLAEGTSAILVSECPLAEIRDNTIRGFHYAVHAPHPVDCTISGNKVENCRIGIHLGFGRNNSIYKNEVRDCEMGYELFHTEMATLEECRADGVKTAVRTCLSTSQIISMEVSNLAKDGVGLLYDAHTDGSAGGTVVLVNCNIRPEMVKLAKPPTTTEKSLLPVTALYCLVVAAKDAPAGATVDVRTVNPMPALPAGAADPNVRNNPAPLTKDSTPLPAAAGTARDALPLIVKGWSMDATCKTLAAPEYEVRVLGADGKPLKSVKTKPEDRWFRAKPDDPTPTVEVSLK